MGRRVYAIDKGSEIALRQVVVPDRGITWGEELLGPAQRSPHRGICEIEAACMAQTVVFEEVVVQLMEEVERDGLVLQQLATNVIKDGPAVGMHTRGTNRDPFVLACGSELHLRRLAYLLGYIRIDRKVFSRLPPR